MARFTYGEKKVSKKSGTILAGVFMLAIAGVLAFGLAFGGGKAALSFASGNGPSAAAADQMAGADVLAAPAVADEAPVVAPEPATEGAHFMSSSATVLSNAKLAVTFDEAGLGNGNINYRISSWAVANYGCINGGGNHPRATNKHTVAEETSGNFTYQSKNGRVQATSLLPVPGPGDFTCPSGQTRVLADVSYTDVVILDMTNNVEEMLAGPFTRTWYTFR